MKVLELQSGFGFDALTIADRPDPTPGRGDVVVKMQAASLNYRDLQVIRGDYPQLRLPLIPVSDGAGEVIAIGSEVRQFRVGDRVCPCYVPDWISGPPTPESVMKRLGGSVDGVLAESVCVPEHAAVKIPKHLSAMVDRGKWLGELHPSASFRLRTSVCPTYSSTPSACSSSTISW